MPTFGISMFVTDYSIQAAELAVAIEERGLDSMWVPEHTHIPTSRKSPYPSGGELPDRYYHSLDPFVALASAAVVTKRIKLATGICLVIERHPIHMAKQVASLDMISNGRVLFGIGAGWNAEEMENHGTPFKRRWGVLRERILAVREIWTKDVAEFHGKYVDFGPMWCWPKPVQPGGPPILLGSRSEKSLDRVAEFCDGWIPLNRPGTDYSDYLKALREAAARHGRRFEDLQLWMLSAPKTADGIKPFIDAGFSNFVTGVDSAKADAVLPQLDQFAEVAAKLR